MKFMLMMNAPYGSGDWNVAEWAHEDLVNHVKYMKQINVELQKAGELVTAEGLASPGQAKLVRANAAGAPEVTDGPFAESKEFLAGYWIVDVEKAEQAYAIAGRVSLAPGKAGKPLHLAVEVREVMSAPPVEP